MSNGEVIAWTQAKFFDDFLEEFERKILPVFARRGYTKGMALMAFISYHNGELIDDVVDILEKEKDSDGGY